MSCSKAYEIELEDLLLAPESQEFKDFQSHCETCESCAGELALQRSLLGTLRGDRPFEEIWHPADEDLLAYHKDRSGLAGGLAERISQHLSGCGECDDALEAFRILAVEVPEVVAAAQTAAETAAEPQPGILERVGDLVRGVFSPGIQAIGAVGAAGLVLALFLSNQGAVDPDGGVRQGPFSPEVRSIRPPVDTLRRDGTESLWLTLRPDSAATVDAEKLTGKLPVLLRLALNEELQTPEKFMVLIRSESGLRSKRQVFEVAPGEEPFAEIQLAGGWLENGRYTVEVTRLASAEGALPQAYSLTVE